MIAAMDDGLGRIRKKLHSMGVDKNTLIFFIGDNGAPLKTGAWNGSLNLPLIGEKGMLTDGGVRVPFVAAWPGSIPAGQVYEHPVSSLDVAATAVALVWVGAGGRRLGLQAAGAGLLALAVADYAVYGSSRLTAEAAGSTAGLPAAGLLAAAVADALQTKPDPGWLTLNPSPWILLPLFIISYCA